jgi:hypothetical protein
VRQSAANDEDKGVGKKSATKVETNDNELVELSVMGEIIPAVWPQVRQYRTGGDGVMRVLPGTGGICYSHQIGDSACDLQGDHVEPGVTIKHLNKDFNSSLNVLSCVGNDATVISGAAKGAKGVVCGTHGGVEHVIIDLPQSTLSKLCIGDKVQVRAHGTGLAFRRLDDVRILNCDPRLIAKWGLSWRGGKLHVPVTHRVPAKIMGSGLGQPSSHHGDYDIQMFDEQVVADHQLNTLRFGDLVAITDADHSYGRRYLGGAVSVGVVVHSRSDVSGHGPGVCSLLTSPTGAIAPKLDAEANLGQLLKLGRWRRSSRGRR